MLKSSIVSRNDCLVGIYRVVDMFLWLQPHKNISDGCMENAILTSYSSLTEPVVNEFVSYLVIYSKVAVGAVD